MEAFSPISRTARPAILRAYRAYLHARDGRVDATQRTLSKREAGMRRFLVAGDRWMDRELFARQYERFDPRRPTGSETLLLLATFFVARGRPTPQPVRLLRTIAVATNSGPLSERK